MRTPRFRRVPTVNRVSFSLSAHLFRSSRSRRRPNRIPDLRGRVAVRDEMKKEVATRRSSLKNVTAFRMRRLLFLFLPAVLAVEFFPRAPGMYPPEETQPSPSSGTVPPSPYGGGQHEGPYEFYYEKERRLHLLVIILLSSSTLVELRPSCSWRKRK